MGDVQASRRATTMAGHERRHGRAPFVGFAGQVIYSVVVPVVFAVSRCVAWYART
jgi:hypothetical protein